MGIGDKLKENIKEKIFNGSILRLREGGDEVK